MTMTLALTLLKEMKSLMLNNELGQTTWLNLHENTFYSKQIWAELLEKDQAKKLTFLEFTLHWHAYTLMTYYKIKRHSQPQSLLGNMVIIL